MEVEVDNFRFIPLLSAHCEVLGLCYVLELLFIRSWNFIHLTAWILKMTLMIQDINHDDLC